MKEKAKEQIVNNNQISTYKIDGDDFGGTAEID